MPSVKVELPKSVITLPAADRDAVLQVIAQAVRLPQRMPIYHESSGDEADIWDSDPHSLLGQAENELYTLLQDVSQTMIAESVLALGLDHLDEVPKLLKSIEAQEQALIKSKSSGRSRISDLIHASREKRERFIQYIQDSNPFSPKQMQKLDKLLKKRLPDFAKIAEDFSTRAGFIGKIRNTAEKEAFQTMGALIDRYPSTIRAAEKEGVTLRIQEEPAAPVDTPPTTQVLTHAPKRRKRKAVKILPLTPLESRSVTHAAQQAGDKMTEVSERHITAIRQLVMQAQKERWSAVELASKLFDRYGEQNRDWRRVAITELAMATNDAYLSGMEEGQTVIGMGALNACKYCKKLVIGQQFTVTHEPPQNTYAHEMHKVWAGKTNVGRRVATYIPCVPLHPNCRCRWHRISRFYKVPEEGGTPVLKETWELIQEERVRRGLGLDPNLPTPKQYQAK